MLACFLQQRGRLGQVAPEFGRKAELGIFARYAQTDAQAQVLRRFAGIVTACIDDLLQFLDGIEAEGFHPVLAIGFANGAGRLHRVHEAKRRVGQRRTHQPHFGDRCHVVMRHAVVPQDLDQIRRRVGLYRIERLARKLLDEETGSARRGVRAVQNDGFVGRERANYGPGVREMRQLKGPPKQSLRTMKRQAALRLGSPLGAAGAAHINGGSLIASEMLE